MTSIPIEQNSSESIRLLRASRFLHGRAKVLVGLQVFLTVLLPVIGAVLSILHPDARPYVALTALVVALLDACIIDRAQRRITRRAATVQEEFDTSVLSMPWDGFSVGAHPDREDIHEAAQKHLRGTEDPTLPDWYPRVAGTLPPHFGRILCQRASLWWDGKLRRVVSRWALGVTIALAVLLAFLGLGRGVTVEALVLGFLAPASPLLFWGIREHLRQRDSAALSDRLKTEAEKLWARAVANECLPEECTAQSRLFQNGIYERRASSPIIFNWVYWIFRDEYEGLMKNAAEDWARQVQTHLK